MMIDDEQIENMKLYDKNIGQLAYNAYNYALWKFRPLGDDEIYDEFKFLDTLIKFDDLLDPFKNLWIIVEFVLKLSVHEFDFDDDTFGLIAYNLFCEQIIKIYPDQKCIEFNEISENMQKVWHMTAHIICEQKGINNF